VYEVDGVIHYCVTNMPGAVPVTSTNALTNATMPYIVQLASAGVVDAVMASPGLKLGVNIAGGQVTYEPVAEAADVAGVPVDEALAARSGAAG
jgi:alanine dehydrogenase